MRVSSVLSAILLIGTCVAQQTVPDSKVVIRSSTREVLLEVVVRDARGRLVKKIDPEQVAVYEDGVRQEIRSFRLVQGSEVRAEDEKQVAEAAAVAQPTPGITPHPPFNPLRTVNVVCLILNDLTPDTRAFAFDAAKKFVDKELRPDTFIGVFSLDSTGIRPVFPFSNNREHLIKAVELAAVNQLPTLAQSTVSMLNGLTLSAAALNGVNGPTIIGGSGAAEGNADGSSPQDPLGTRGDMGVAVQAGLREIDALTTLVKQLSQLPFQKTVMMMSTGLTRPPDQLEYWNALIKSANKGGVTFYGLDVHGLDPAQDPADPFEVPGKRASPFVSTSLPPGADPFVYFVVYPAQNSGAVPGLRAQFLKDGQVLTTQKSALPLPDESGAIPMTIRAIREPGDYEVRITVEQGSAAIERSLKYSIAAK